MKLIGDDSFLVDAFSRFKNFKIGEKRLPGFLMKEVDFIIIPAILELYSKNAGII